MENIIDKIKLLEKEESMGNAEEKLKIQKEELCRREEEILKMLTPEQRKLFAAYMDTVDQIGEFENNKFFKNGFKLATELFIEILWLEFIWKLVFIT